MNQDELKEVLRLHRLWLDGAEGGKRAELRETGLSESDLYRANLREADLRSADLSGADLRNADLSDADLSLADLRGADLSSADLRWSDLSGADLSGACLSGAIGDGKRIKTVVGMRYHINIWDDMMSIGCQQHRIDKWFSFDDETIAAMDSGALEWWSANKQNIQFLVKMLSGE